MKCRRCKEEDIPLMDYWNKQGVCDLCFEAKKRVEKQKLKDAVSIKEEKIKKRMELIK